ncbi:Ser/Thr protein phosphatase, putative [Trichomonas vaginalis G3]|uniref:Serine/threonine-protein phosphatase n=1 Tax=Trichomonas vaginalis (strain ATCC PRA-98 / G3) TaxID=412133 RepID=A2FGA5_TRIV3|nr:serine/threonine-specific protein phosphatase/bis(5-nucleosyl)-tetraphosphatase [Trichomonas vaginalis G3]EAX96051.1 Ser/Thr protein phosphatase, putative [Trichomonas vaginalis G3]KAI5503995.1 serine/threonine-specific protein phosphatase/bis(5-nucleosyl)-tetraphosphatase [Trichomonas vaginalis G3]|eukprot:XP_001308981.1 Ser/Thr protein phosphatase [Trichomonas vaginalis G3]
MDLDKFISDIRERKQIAESDFVSLLRLARDIFYQEGTVINLSSPISVCGDVHGQFEDVIELFDVGGLPPDTKYLFLGDYVDRGYYSIDTLALLLAYKVKYPTRFFMLRGNHECRQVNNAYGFYEEILSRFGFASLWQLCNDIFNFLPIGATIDGKIFCVHGGLSPKVRIIEQLALAERRVEPENGTEISDILWSDPEDQEGWGMNQRGAGYLFGINPTKEFCFNNKLELVARAHQLANEGYQWHHDRKLVTVWSAPNYMYRSNNKASIMEVSADRDLNFKIFDAVPAEKRLTPTDRITPPGAFGYFA